MHNQVHVRVGVELDRLMSISLQTATVASRGVLAEGGASGEARSGTAFRELLAASGWLADEPWTPLRRDLTDEVEDCGIRVEVGAWSATTRTMLLSPWRRSGRPGRDDRACSSRWVSIGITAATGTARPAAGFTMLDDVTDFRRTGSHVNPGADA